MAGINLPGESGQAGLQEEIFYASSMTSDNTNQRVDDNTNSNEEEDYNDSIGDDGFKSTRLPLTSSNFNEQQGSTVQKYVRIDNDKNGNMNYMSISELKNQQLGGRNIAKEQKKVNYSVKYQIMLLTLLLLCIIHILVMYVDSIITICIQKYALSNIILFIVFLHCNLCIIN